MSETWTQVLALFLANITVICWFRSESRADWRHMDNKLDTTIAAFNLTIKTIQEEMKDFHTRLMIQDLNFKNTMKEIRKKGRNKK